jgi:hypothetical protein
MKCWNPECGSTNADEFCIATLVNATDHDAEDLVVDDDNDDPIQNESATLATWCYDCRKLTYKPNWVAIVLDFVGPRWQGMDPLILPKQ